MANANNERRAKQFEGVAELARAIASLQELDQLLPTVVAVISERFNHDHVGIYLNDELREYTLLSAANSESGKRLLERGYKLRIGSADIVATVANTGRAQIAQDLGGTPAYATALAETRSQLAIPLKRGEMVLGVLDVQSKLPESFDQTDIAVFSILADQIATAIQNAALFRETQTALSESQVLYGTVIKQAWKMSTKGVTDLGYRMAGKVPTRLDKPVSSPEAYIAMESGDVVVTPRDQKTGDNMLAVPLKLRGDVIGVISVKMPVDVEIGQDEIDIVQAAAERTALALENSALLDDSQRRAVRERSIGEMSARIGAGTEIDSILRTAVRELGSQLGGVQISVEMGNGHE
jgi:GAF domain-containing protein